MALLWLLAVGRLAVAEPPSELNQPTICSPKQVQVHQDPVCKVTSLGHGQHEIKLTLVSQTGPVRVGGYVVTTEHYNDGYLAPVVEAIPGDTLIAHLKNILMPRKHSGMAHGDADLNPTNLHYFHGGIVSPANALPTPAELGTGDNIYVHLKSATGVPGANNEFDLKVPIPGDGMLDARVLEQSGTIPHPLGLGWYHSHLHGISADQVMGGMSGLLSVGDADALLSAACKPNPKDETQCLNNVAKETADLKRHTDVRYAVLRDITLKATPNGVLKAPLQADGDQAAWDPDAEKVPSRAPCGGMKADGSGLDFQDTSLRTGYCQQNTATAWLFTLNGQRFPTITVGGGRNVLLRLGNLSANVAYWLELCNQADNTCSNLTIISVDGLAPAKPVPVDHANETVKATEVPDIVLMPASRAEIYIRNDTTVHDKPILYALRAKKFATGQDVWPEIQLAQVRLEPTAQTSGLTLAVAPLVAKPQGAGPAALLRTAVIPAQPADNDGCARDLDPGFHEHRRITFINGSHTDWAVVTDIIRPGDGLAEEDITQPAGSIADSIGPFAFEDYVLDDGTVDWNNPSKKHVCITLDHDGSHMQLWGILNATGTLHNFHIHQMKFRLATAAELNQHGIKTPDNSQTCPSSCAAQNKPSYRIYDDGNPPADPNSGKLLWHDTIPVPPLTEVFVVMSFDAQQQVGRFVFHCHILKHEDNGLMAPIEVRLPAAPPQ